MGAARDPTPTVSFIDEYCAAYRDLFEDVRSFEHLCLLHLGLISDLPRKSLPAIGHRVGADPQALHNFIANANWSLEKLREKRLELTREALRERPFVVIIDETGDLKKGKTTDYVARQYIGNLGTVDRGIVSVSAYTELMDEQACLSWLERHLYPNGWVCPLIEVFQMAQVLANQKGVMRAQAAS
jgi:SRSO17 transposase